MYTEDNLNKSLLALGIGSPGDIFKKLNSNYTQSDRHYHSANHVSECLTHLHRFSHRVTNLAEVEIAIWFHDAIYDTHKHDNEERSAQWATHYLSSHKIDSKVIARINELILCTKSHEPSTMDAAVLLDIDLGILGSKPDVFESYDKAIRREYHWVPEPDYRNGRAAILRSFLDRKSIYTTAEFIENHEQQARTNLKRKILELST